MIKRVEKINFVQRKEINIHYCKLFIKNECKHSFSNDSIMYKYVDVEICCIVCKNNNYFLKKILW